MDMSQQDAMEITSFSGSGTGLGNISLTCAAAVFESINGSLLPAPVDIGVRVFLSIYNALLVILGLFLNTLVLLMIYKFQSLRTISFAIAGQISATNLVLTLIRVFPNVVNQIAGKWVFGFSLCAINGFVAATLAVVRMFLMFTFSVDKFAAVYLPFSYPKFSPKIVTFLCVLAWSSSFLVNLIGVLPMMDCYIYSEPLVLCLVSPTCSRNCYYYYYFTLTFAFILPVAIPTLLITLLFLKGKKIRKRELNMNGLDKTISDKEWRATITFILLFVAIFVVIIFPIAFINIAHHTGKYISILLDKLGVSIIFAVVVIDPIIIMRNADVRECLGALKNQLKNSFPRSSARNGVH